MQCPKCAGFMMYEKFMDMEETSRFYFYGWRCISCGTIVDSTILANKVYKDRQKENKRRRLKKAC
ncbi:MAG: hypothetical protein HZC13_03190 [Nitrospirae bacterium]|nr:hypothetical protein [Nitrospirota bacterium]MBI5097066.1 hypothetical protein [Nitrospirota bacterium]